MKTRMGFRQQCPLARGCRLNLELLEPRTLLAVDLSAHIGGSDDPVMPGDEVTYDVIISNFDDDPADNARLQSEMSPLFESVRWILDGKQVASGDIDIQIDVGAQDQVVLKVIAIAGSIVDDVVASSVSIAARDDTYPYNNQSKLTHRSPQVTQIPRYVKQVNICKDETFILNGDLYFIGWDGGACFASAACASSGPYAGDLWKTDGTTEGTHQVKRIRTERDGEPRILDAFGKPQFTNYQNILYFVADDGIHGEELWRSDGTETGTYMVKDINSAVQREMRFCTELDYNQPSKIENLQVLNDRLIFTAKDETGQRRSWSSDGTEAGTRVEEGLIVPPRPPDPPSNQPTVTFEADRFYLSDGTPEGRRLIADWPRQKLPLWISRGPDPSDIHVIGDTVVFNTNRDYEANHLLALDLRVDEVSILEPLVIDLSQGTTTTKSYATEFLGFTQNGAPGTFLPCEACREAPDDVLGDNQAVFQLERRTDSVDVGFPAPIVDGPGDDITVDVGFEGVQSIVFGRANDGEFKRLGEVSFPNPGLDLREAEWEGPLTALRIQGAAVRRVQANIDATAVLTLEAVNSPGLQFDWDLNNDGIFGEQVGRSVGLSIRELRQHGLDIPGEYEIAVRMNDRVDDYFDTALLTVVGELPLFGDLNSDGQVAFEDFLILAANFGKQQATAVDGDIDGNTRVDFGDFIILADNYGRRSAK